MPNPSPMQEISEMNRYIDSLTIKALAVESSSTEMLSKLHTADENLRTVSKEFNLEIHEVKSALHESEKELKLLSAKLQNLIQEFKQVVKKEDMERFEAKIDYLQFEQFVTRKELERFSQR